MSPRRKMPTKAELIQLQKLYRTDERIGERLGGVPAYLVAYWRRKKGVPKHSLPKFSEKEIRNLWERYGDDDKCGLELGISKAAFYNWRRRYGIREKPVFLKLEQLELDFPGLKLQSRSVSLYGKQTVAQKILSGAVQKERVEVGETVEVEPDLAVSTGDSSRVVREFRQLRSEYVWNPGKILVALGSCPSDDLRDLAEAYALVREFAKRQGINSFYDVGEGSCHQIAVERGQVLPGQCILSTDKYVASYGCLSALATAIDMKEMATLWASGKITFDVPRTVRIDITGRRRRGVYAKDVALSVMKQLSSVDIKEKVIEYYGRPVSQMSISERFTLANLSRDIGAGAAICPYDSTVRRYLTGRTSGKYTAVVADKNAEYDQIYQINIDHLTPQLAKAGSVQNVKAVSESEGVPLDLILLGTCSNGRFDDLRVATDILKGKKIDPACRLLIYPSSRSVYLEALKKGLIRVLVEAGAIVMNPGCGQSLGGNALLAPGERALATTNGAYASGIDSKRYDIYLGSPATAAASALNAAVTDPTRYVK